MEIKVTRKCFHVWVVLIRTIEEQWKFMTFDYRRSFLMLYSKCFILPQSEEDILEFTNKFIKENDLKSLLLSKEYYWEYAEKEQEYDDAMKWAYLYKFYSKLLEKADDDTKTIINAAFSPAEIEWQMQGGDLELLD
jgi:hypothetical protein